MGSYWQVERFQSVLVCLLRFRETYFGSSSYHGHHHIHKANLEETKWNQKLDEANAKSHGTAAVLHIALPIFQHLDLAGDHAPGTASSTLLLLVQPLVLGLIWHSVGGWENLFVARKEDSHGPISPLLNIIDMDTNLMGRVTYEIGWKRTKYHDYLTIQISLINTRLEAFAC